MVLDELVGLEDVGADLAAPCDFALLVVAAFDFGLLFVFLDLIELCFEHAHGEVLVFALGAFVLAGDDDAGRFVGDADGGFDLIDVLAALAAGAVGIDLEVDVADFDIDGVVDFWDDVDAAEGRVAPALGVEWGDADETVDPAFVLEVAVGVGA